MASVFIVGGRCYNPPINADEWIAPRLVREADDATAGRIADAFSASREVRLDKVRLETAATSQLVGRLETLKRELQASIAAASDFRRFQVAALLADVDRLLAEARAEILRLAKQTYTTAADLGAAHTTNAVDAAQFHVATIAGVSADLVTHAFENTADLLTEPMQRFRGAVATTARRVALNADSFAGGMATLARQIGATGLDAVEFKAERILRTELSRTFNGASFDRMLALADRIPSLRKIWIRANDGRTRASHVAAGATYAPGQGIPIRDWYHVGRAKLRYPVDPLAEPGGKTAAAETIMCRCNGAVDFDPEELRQSAATRIQLAMGGPAPVVVEPTIQKPTPLPKPKKPAAVQTAEGTRAKILKTSEKGAAEIARLKAERDALGDQSTKAFQAYIDATTRGDTINGARFGPLHQAYLEITKRAQAIHDETVKLETARAVTLRKLVQVPTADRGKLTVRISEPLMAKDWQASVRAAVKEFEKLVGTRTIGTGPTWVDSANGAIEVRFARDAAGLPGARSHADTAGHYIAMGTRDAGVVVHELGHILEARDATVHQKALAFLDQRRGTEALKTMRKITGNDAYAENEVAWEDKFVDAYMGKDYSVLGHRYATEIVSMGVEQFYRDPARLAKLDPEYFDFIFNLLRGR